MSARLLVVPAAGHGTRLRSALPKVLVPVLGRPMLDWLLALYARHVERVMVVTSPAARAAVQTHAGSRAEVVVQDEPTGMLDAVLMAARGAEGRPHPSCIWITWCDQIGVHPRTLERLAEYSGVSPAPALTLPTVWRSSPYVHLQRESAGRITRVLHRREGDAMPDCGESDMGVFALSPNAFFEQLPRYASAVEAGPATGERNFLPFIPWLSARAEVVTFPSEEPEEAIGINTPEDFEAVARYLQSRPT